MVLSFSSFDLVAYDETEIEIFSIITKQIKDHEATAGEQLVRSLADAIVAFCITKSCEDGFDLEGVLDLIWGVIVDVASFVPRDDPRHDYLVQWLVLVRQRGDLKVAGEETRWWDDLPSLAMAMREKWRDPTDIDAASSATDEVLPESFRQWCNLNSFAAKLSAMGCRPWMTLPIWQLRTVLEERPVNRTAIPCQLWVATEWLIRCSDILYQEMTSNNVIDEGTAKALQPGVLCPAHVKPLSLARWMFWKSKLEEVDEKDTARAQEGPRCAEALERMAMAERKQ